ncbi:NADPH oxidase 4 [Irineochytrium annulatum]|nr:NADPH oxidase 4 [Irineochytrium annulatum]
MLITITRHSFVNTLLGVPFNEAIKVHKNLGYLIFIAGLVHTAVYIVSASVDVGQSLVSHLFNVNWNDPNSPMGMMGGTGPIPVWGMGMYLTPLGFFCMVALVPPFLMSLPQVRRWNYGFFKWTHWLMIPVSALAWLHVPADFYFMTPGIIIYTIDLVVRFIAYKNPHTVTRVTTSDGGYLRVDVQINPNAPNASVAANVRGGHYFNLNFPSVSKHEWHPFSVAADTQSTPGQLTFLIEPTRLPSRWTSRASAALQSASSSDAPLPVALDGPFGHPAVPLRSNTHATAALILCAGSGLGPATAVAHDAARTGARVLLCWSTRGREGVSGVVVRDGLLAELAGEKRAGSVVRVHQTGGRVELADGVGAKKDAEIEAVSPVEGGADGVEWREGRIDFGAAAAEAAEMVTSVNAKGGSVLVFVCGPGGFTRDAAKAVSAFGRANAGSGVKFDVEAEGFFY